MEEQKVALTQDEIEELLSAIEHPIIRFAVALLCYTGLRVKEAQTLLLEDIDFEYNRLSVKGKGKKHRYVPIAQSFKPYLDEYITSIRESEDSPFLLATKRTGKLSSMYINNELHRAVEKLGWNKTVTCHALRRSFATNLLRKGVNVFAISKLLGHASIKTTTLYLQLNENELKEAVDKL